MNLDGCIAKINEVAQDLREMDRNDQSDLEHQAKKLDRVVSDLGKIRASASTYVHGSGTGED